MRSIAVGFAALALSATLVEAETITQLLSKKCLVVGDISGVTVEAADEGTQQMSDRTVQFLIFQCPEFRVYSCPVTIAAPVDNPAQIGLSAAACLPIKNME